jgi:hypothetical protein
MRKFVIFLLLALHFAVSLSIVSFAIFLNEFLGAVACGDDGEDFCSGGVFTPYEDYLIIEGEVALLYKGFMRTQTQLGSFDANINFNDQQCDSYDNVILNFSKR